MEKVLTEGQGKVLLQIARMTISDRLGQNIQSPDAVKELPDTAYATFVTLKKNGQLRGCIGNLQPTGSVLESVQRNAVNAAFHDSRFPPLTIEELQELAIDISVLSQAEILEYSDGDDLLGKLRPGIDGVILRLGMASATFLPQVWEQLSTPALFLDHLCRKAGLAESAWRNEHPQIEIYQVQFFAEENR